MAKEPNDKPTSALAIRSVPESFCRAGRRWTREVQVVPVSEFSKPQVQALKSDLNLVVLDTEIMPVASSEEGI